MIVGRERISNRVGKPGTQQDQEQTARLLVPKTVSVITSFRRNIGIAAFQLAGTTKGKERESVVSLNIHQNKCF